MKCCKEHLVITIQCQLTWMFLTTCCKKETTFPELHQFCFSSLLDSKNKALAAASYYISQKPAMYEQEETKYDREIPPETGL